MMPKNRYQENMLWLLPPLSYAEEDVGGLGMDFEMSGLAGMMLMMLILMNL